MRYDNHQIRKYTTMITKDPKDKKLDSQQLKNLKKEFVRSTSQNQTYKEVSSINKRISILIKKWIFIFYVLDLNLNNKYIRLLSNIIYKRYWIWGLKKFKKQPKKDIYLNLQLNNKESSLFNGESVSKISSFITYNKLNCLNMKILHFPVKYDDKTQNYLFISNLTNLDIIRSLIPNENGIYLFWYNLDPRICYLGSSVNLKRRIIAHINQSKISNNRHPKFYSFINKYGWFNMNLQIQDLHQEPNKLQEREQFWLDLIFESYGPYTLNILTKSQNSKGLKISEESKKLMSKLKLGVSLSEEHKKNISKGKQGVLHHYFGKKRDQETVLKMKESLKIYYKNNKHPRLGIKKTEEEKEKLRKIL